MFENLKKTTSRLFETIDNPKLKEMMKKCFWNTINTTCKFEDDGSVFVITGDIPAMWLRDSSAQVMQYLNFSDDEDVRKLIKGVLNKQFYFINMDAYANAFMENENCVSEWAGLVETNYLPKQVWERKFELDSLAYPIFLLCKYVEKTNDISFINKQILSGIDKIISLCKVEQEHNKLSDYYFIFKIVDQKIFKANRNDLKNKTGLVWSGFRPSDDLCKYHYHIPDNMFMVSALYKLLPILEKLGEFDLEQKALLLLNEIKEGLDKFSTKEVPGFGKIYVSETDTEGNVLLDDDANIPSLLSIPYLEYPYTDKTIYENTRKYILSKSNKYYFEGKVLKGIGSPHTPGNNVWPLSIIMQGLTSNNKEEITNCLDMLLKSDANTSYIHEGVNADDPNIYSRSWFAWANSLFSEFIIQKILKK